jgi:hypothetical protein
MTAGYDRICGWWSGDLEREKILMLIRRHQIGVKKAVEALMELDRQDGKTSGGETDDESD